MLDKKRFLTVFLLTPTVFVKDFMKEKRLRRKKQGRKKSYLRIFVAKTSFIYL